MSEEMISEGDSSVLPPDVPEMIPVHPSHGRSKIRWASFDAETMLKDVARSTTKHRYKRWHRKVRKALASYWAGVMSRTLESGMIGSSFGCTLHVSERPPGATGPVQEPDFRSDFEKWEEKCSHLLV